MSRDDDRLRDILDAIENVRRHTEGGRETFDANELVRVWVVHHLEIIGEAASQLSGDTRDALADVPWRSIVGMRNALIHGYFDIDEDAVWRVVEDHLDELEASIEEALDDPG